jgi:hypothetical protein
MKIFTLVILLIPSAIFGQSLALDDLIIFQRNDFVKTNDILTAKGWEFSHSKKAELGTYNTITWAFHKNEYDEALGWLTLYSDEDSENILSYQMHNGKIYNQLKYQINLSKMKLVSSSVEDNKISSIYQGLSHTVTISITSGEDKSNPHYLIGVMTNKTYKIIKLNEFFESLDQSGKGETKLNAKYDGEFIYKSKAFSYAQVFKDLDLTERVYMVPPDNYVYIISELTGGKVRVFCNGKYGYMNKSMLNR